MPVTLGDCPKTPSPVVLAGRLEAGVKELVRYAGTVDGNPPVEPFIGVLVPLSTVLAIELGELLVHGYDIARAARLRGGSSRRTLCWRTGSS